MRILGIDPGTAQTGFGIIEEVSGKIRAVDFGCIRTRKEDAKEIRLGTIYQELRKIIELHSPDIVAQELLYFNRNTKTALSVGEARGVILLAAAHSRLNVREYTPLQVKESLSGYGRASKNEVKEMVKLHLDLPTFKGTDDAADALAIALCHFFFMDSGELR